MSATAELILIRHAPTVAPDRLCGRTDVEAQIDPNVARAVAQALPTPARVISSPAKRCQQTATALFGAGFETDERLWEQNFGTHEGLKYTELPDIGALTTEALAAYAAPEGESFLDVCARIKAPLFEHASTTGPTVIVAHAGVIRASLGVTLGAPARGLLFEVGHLSVTRLRCSDEGPISIIDVNRTWPA